MTGAANTHVQAAVGRRTTPAGLGRTALAARYLGAIALIGVGYEHIHQYSADYYSQIPTIGTLFALNFVSATAVGLGLLAPVGRFAGRWARPVLMLLALSGVGIAAGSIAGLYLSEHGGLFGFTEVGYRQAIVVSIALEAATIVLLGAYAVMSWPRRPRNG